MATQKQKCDRKSRKEKLDRINEQIGAIDQLDTPIEEHGDDFCSLADEIEAIKNKIRKRINEEAATFQK